MTKDEKHLFNIISQHIKTWGVFRAIPCPHNTMSSLKLKKCSRLKRLGTYAYWLGIETEVFDQLIGQLEEKGAIRVYGGGLVMLTEEDFWREQT